MHIGAVQRIPDPGYAVPMTTTPAHTATYAAVFDRIARSFELL